MSFAVAPGSLPTQERRLSAEVLYEHAIMSQPPAQFAMGGPADQNAAPSPYVQQWQGSAHRQQQHTPGPRVPSRLPVLHSSTPLTAPAPPPVAAVSPYLFGGFPVPYLRQTPAVALEPVLSNLGAPITQQIASPPTPEPIHQSMTSPRQTFPNQQHPPFVPEPLQSAPGWSDGGADDQFAPASPGWFSTDPADDRMSGMLNGFQGAASGGNSAHTPAAAAASPGPFPQPQDEDADENLFNEFDKQGNAVLKLDELCGAISKYVGKREVSAADVMRVTERMNAELRGEERISVHRVTLGMFRKILRAIRPTDFAGKELLKGWLESTGILDAFTDELDRFVTGQGASRKDVIEVLSAVSKSQVQQLCSAFHGRLDSVVADAVEQLRSTPQAAFNAEQANHKFAMMDDAQVGSFADVAEFFKGLDGHIGLPSPRVLDMMYLEHCGSLDSHDSFVTTNYGGTETYPALEWEFVTNPDVSKTYPGGERKPTPLDRFLGHATRRAADLEEPEVIALRLFTGPMFMKYNAKLRNFPDEDVKNLKGNGYVTTIHAVVSGVLKLSRIWKPPENRKVYRGLGGMVLPERFWKADKFGCRGGVELALMSTTIKREIAIQYSGTEKDRPTIFEIEVGQVDRGASLRWVSQYPVEEEVVMPPLSNLEVVGDARMEVSEQGLVMVIPLRINVNLKSLTMNELKDRRKQLHLSMVGNLFQEAQRDLTEELTKVNTSNVVASSRSPMGALMMSQVSTADDPGDSASVTSIPTNSNVDASVQEKVAQMLSDFDGLVATIGATDSTWFNDDTNYKNAMTSALDMKRGTLRKFHELQSKRMQHVSVEVRQRIRESNCADWARDGTVYRIISNTVHFPWEAVAEGKVPDVELLPSLTQEQAAVAWEALAANSRAAQDLDGPPAVQAVQIRGLDGKVGKMLVREAIYGKEFAMITERLGIDGVRIPEVQGMGPDGVRLLIPLFRMNHNLVQIDLSRSRMGPELARELARVLAEKPNLEIVKIRGMIQVKEARTYPEVDMATRRVPVQMRRQSLLGLPRRPLHSHQRPLHSHHHAKPPSEGGWFLSRAALSQTLSLRRVTRMSPQTEDGWEPCDVEGGIVLAAFIGANARLSRLDLAGNRIGPEGATALAEVMDGRRLGLLTHLDLRDNNICAPGATALSAALIRHQRLTFLDVRDNRTGASGPVQLAPAISANPRLATLNEVSIEPETREEDRRWVVRKVTDPAYEMVFVASRISSMVGVVSLDLADCQLGKEGARRLRRALMGCSGLRELVLRGNALRAEGAVEIAPALAACLALEVLDLSHNHIQDEGTEAVAQALHGHPSLRSLNYAGNLPEGFIEFSICCPRFRSPYRAIAAAVPRARVKFFAWRAVVVAVLSWGIIVLSTLAFCTGLFGAPIAFADQQYIYGFGIMGIGVTGLLGIGWWVLWTGVRWRLGFVDCFVRIVKQREEEKMRRNMALRDRMQSTESNRDRLESAASVELDQPHGTGSLATNGDSRSFTQTQNANIPWRRARSRSAGNGPHPHIGELSPVPSAESQTAETLEIGRTNSADDSRDAQDEHDLQAILGERLSQQVPMLLEQYVHNTTHPASLDQQLLERDEYIKRYWTVGTFFHSTTPLALALRRTTVKWLLAICVLYCGAVFGFFLWPYIYGIDFTFRTFRVVIYQNQAREVNPAASLSALSIVGVYCAPNNLGQTDPLLIFSRNTVAVEYEFPVTVGRWQITSSDTNPTDMDPRKFELQGCSERYHHCRRWEVISGNRTDPDFPEARGVEAEYDLDEAWQQTMVRFVPFVFAFGFLALLYCSLSNRHEYGRPVLSATFGICSLMYIISTHPMRIFEDRIRWVSGGCLSFMPLMLILDERYILIAIVLYGLIYCPMVGILFQRIYDDEALPQWSHSLGIRNYDQFTIMPIFVVANCLLLPIIAKYCWYRAKTKVLVLQDMKDYKAIWEGLLRTEPDALKDLKGEIDKIHNAIEQAIRAGVEDEVPRHRVMVMADTIYKKLPRAGSLTAIKRRASTRVSTKSSTTAIKKSDPSQQHISSLWQVYAQATGLEVLLRSKVQSWALLTKGGFFNRRGDFVRWEFAKDNPRLVRKLVFQKLKETTRAIEKVIRFYERDVSRLLDICRQQIIFESVEDISHCLAVIRQDSEVQLVRAKSRMDPDTDQHKVYSGYRDIALNFRFKTEEAEMLGIDGHVCEVRLVHHEFANMLQGPEGRARHQRYVQYREARGL